MNPVQEIQLAPREREVLGLFVAGLASKEVAHEMGLTLETVLWYSKRIYKTLNVHNRAAAVRIALERGLVPRTSEASSQRRAVSASIRPLIGRREELATLERMLDQGRLVSLVGMGGAGKTCLAMEAARRRQDRYADGVIDIRLDHVDDEAGLLSALADALEVSIKDLGADPWAQLRGSDSARQRLLLLDNFEQLKDHAARLHELLSALPNLSILVTSRLPLGVPGEALLRLDGMACPTGADQTPEAFDAVALFIDEVQRRAPERRFERAELTALAEVCRQLGGMPLAILLAACWAEVLPIAQILDQVADRPELLASDGIVPARHRRLDHVIDATLELRSDDERTALARMSAFAGGFDRAAAQQVAGCSVETLAVLIRSSLLIYDAARDRYRMHPLVEERARALAKRTAVWDSGRAQHQAHYAALVRATRPLLLGSAGGPGQAEASRTLDIEHANVRRAWHTALERGDADAIGDMLEPLVLWFDLRTRLAEGVLMLRAALDSDVAHVHSGMLQLFHDWLAMQGGSLGPTAADPGTALAQLDASGAAPELLRIAKVMAAFLYMVAHGRADEAVRISVALESEAAPLPAYWNARRLMLLSLLQSGMGDTALALVTAERMLEVALSAGELTGAHLAVAVTSWMALRLGELDRIPHFLQVGEQLMERLADAQHAGLARGLTAVLAVWHGELDAAAMLFEEPDRLASSDNVSIRSVAHGIEALHAGLHGRRVQAEAARAAIDVPAVEGLWPEVIAWAEWGLTLACASSRDWAAAQTHIERMRTVEDAPWCVLAEFRVLEQIIAALRFAAEGKTERARQQLATARGLPSRAHAMYAAWEPVATLDSRDATVRGE